MGNRSRAYIIINTLMDYVTTFNIILKSFKARLIAIDRFPVNQFVLGNIGFYKELKNKGIINIYKINNKWHLNVSIYELTLLK